MKKVYLVTVLTCLFVVAVSYGLHFLYWEEDSDKVLKVGMVCVYDESSAYTGNFTRSIEFLEEEYGDRIEILTKYNVPEDEVILREAVQELVDQECEIIFGTSYGYESILLEYAKNCPDIQFCQATGDNCSAETPVNYHTFMGMIYEGRYTAGVVAGMKLEELIQKGEIRAEDAKVGYVAAFPYAEVISGYTSFLLGVRSVVPNAVMDVKYTNTWGDYFVEKNIAEDLIEGGCVIISQHSDTIGPAVACEELGKTHTVYHVGYNRSMIDVAPTTTLVGSRINWYPYIVDAVGAVLRGKKIEDVAKASRIFGNDSAGGFEENWVEMLELNTVTCAPGTKAEMDKVKQKLIRGEIQVFQGSYVGVNPFDPTDTYDLSNGFDENSHRSSPEFGYVLNDIITVLDDGEF